MKEALKTALANKVKALAENSKLSARYATLSKTNQANVRQVAKYSAIVLKLKAQLRAKAAQLAAATKIDFGVRLNPRYWKVTGIHSWYTYHYNKAANRPTLVQRFINAGTKGSVNPYLKGYTAYEGKLYYKVKARNIKYVWINGGMTGTVRQDIYLDGQKCYLDAEPAPWKYNGKSNSPMALAYRRYNCSKTKQSGAQTDKVVLIDCARHWPGSCGIQAIVVRGTA